AIGEVLGKAGDNEAALYKQMHTLFHQWQTLSYSDTIDAANNCLGGDPDEHRGGDGGTEGKPFNVATALEKRFGDNHVDLKINEKVSISKVELAEGSEVSAGDIDSLPEDPLNPGNVLISVADANSQSNAP